MWARPREGPGLCSPEAPSLVLHQSSTTPDTPDVPHRDGVKQCPRVPWAEEKHCDKGGQSGRSGQEVRSAVEVGVELRTLPGPTDGE